MTHQTEPLALLRDTEHYLSALHGSVARHDNLAADYGCAGCELRDRIAAAVSAAVAPPTDRAAAEAALAAVEAALGDTLLPDAREDALARLMKVLPPTTDRAAVRAQAFDEAADMLAKLDPVKAALAGEHAWRDAAGLVRHMARQARRMADETATETPAEDPARIDRLRPEFFEHASVESIDAQIRRAQRQQRHWGNRERTLAILRQTRVMQKEHGEWPAAGARQDGAES
jgi:hypothetical protein